MFCSLSLSLYIYIYISNLSIPQDTLSAYSKYSDLFVGLEYVRTPAELEKSRHAVRASRIPLLLGFGFGVCRFQFLEGLGFRSSGYRV